MTEKKYALRNSYFKNRKPSDPGTLSGIVAFMKQHGELPFRYDGPNWVYDTVCEMQKRSGVMHSQFLTPHKTAWRMAEVTAVHTSERTVIDACCGTGQLTGPLLSWGFEVKAFDIDSEMLSAHNHLYPQVQAVQATYNDWLGTDTHPLIISNPPYEMEPLKEFMQWLSLHLEPRGFAVLLLPSGFIDKSRPKTLAATLSGFRALHREPMPEQFERTNIRAEIVVLQKLEGFGL